MNANPEIESNGFELNQTVKSELSRLQRLDKDGRPNLGLNFHQGNIDRIIAHMIRTYEEIGTLEIDHNDYLFALRNLVSMRDSLESLKVQE